MNIMQKCDTIKTKSGSFCTKISPPQSLLIFQLAMRDEDRVLVQSLLRLDRSIREVKLWRCCETNRQALDDAMDEYADPTRSITDSVPQALCPVLKEIGITRMNIKGRRFSVL